MSLPWRYSTSKDYIDGTIQQLQQQEQHKKEGQNKLSKLVHLKVGKYYLHGDEPTTDEIISLFEEVEQHPIVTEISLCGVYINNDSSNALMKVLHKQKRNRLNLINCIPGGGSIRALAGIEYLQYLRISECQTIDSDFIALGMHLLSNQNLIQLDICDEIITPSKSKSLSDGLIGTTSLKALEFSFCTFQTDAATSLATGLSKNQSIESLSLPGCELEDDDIASIIRSLSSNVVSSKNNNNNRIQKLKLFRNHCETLGVSALENLLIDNRETNTYSTIEVLDLSYQQFERSKKLDITHLSTCLAANHSLISLSLSFNKLNDTDATKLAKAIQYCYQLEELDMRANNIRDAGAIACAKHLVAVGGNDDRDRDGADAGRHTTSTKRLQKLFLYGNPIGNVGAESLLHAIRDNVSMQVLNLNYNTCSYELIQLYTLLNRAGRKLLKEHQFNPALWPYVLERTQKISKESHGICSDADLIYHLIQGPALLM